MKTILIKLAFIICLFISFSGSTNAQYTETFEAQAPYKNYFTSNGQAFTLTNSFSVFSSRSGFGYQHSNRFIDNGNNVAINQINGIKTSDSRPFNVKSLWLYVSKDGGSNPSTDGSIIITGKLAGVVKFTINKTTGFSPTFVPDNGFTFINFATENGVNNSNMGIDEIEFQLQGNFDYAAIDNFTFTSLAVLPISLVSYTASLQPDSKVKLSWQTASENNVAQFIIFKSTDGRNFQKQATLPAIGSGSTTTNYGFVDNAPLQGVNYYRLEQVDLNGNVKNLGIKTILIASRFNKPTMFPNPSRGENITLRSVISPNMPNNYMISDPSGRIVRKGNIISQEQILDVSGLSSGKYSIILSNGEVINWIKN
ncbi:MAG: T9SS type A sorting domain-containing protein [Bacteroidota bacterium]|nr:T9SS type A sorting domain-containing protein [Bacteroidota bacterium]